MSVIYNEVIQYRIFESLNNAPPETHTLEVFTKGKEDATGKV